MIVADHARSGNRILTALDVLRGHLRSPRWRWSTSPRLYATTCPGPGAEHRMTWFVDGDAVTVLCDRCDPDQLAASLGQSLGVDARGTAAVTLLVR